MNQSKWIKKREIVQENSNDKLKLNARYTIITRGEENEAFLEGAGIK